MGFWDKWRGKKGGGGGSGRGGGPDGGDGARDGGTRWIPAEASPFGVRTLDLRPATDGRSWTGKVMAVGRGRRLGDRLTIDELSVADQGFGPFTDAPSTFDWLLRTHALGEVLPLPVSGAELAMLVETPLIAFNGFGHRAPFAASGFSAPRPTRPLRVFGAIVQAVRGGDLAQVRASLAAGEDPNVPSPFEGFTALHLAMVSGAVDIMRALLAGGANPKLRSDRGRDPIGLGIVQGLSPEVLEELLAAGATLDVATADGFGLLHAAAEADRAPIVPWLVGRGLTVEARTNRGLTPLHIACARGGAAVARALIAAGADVVAPSSLGTPRALAEKEGHGALAALFPQ